MENNERIYVDGVWYVREKEPEKEIELNECVYAGIVVENGDFCFKAEIMEKSEGTFFDQIDLYVTDKREKPWKEDVWDNNQYLIGILEKDEDCLNSLGHFGQDNILFLTKFLEKLVEKNWLKWRTETF